MRRDSRAPPCIFFRGGRLEAEHAVAVVGARNATRDAIRFAERLCAGLVRAGAVVVSGGALGIDAAAHRAAIHAGGRTWVIAGTGPDRCYPSDHAELFDTIGAGPGAMVWLFGPGPLPRSSFLTRNRVLVALADAVVVVQAGLPSGALHAASWARRLQKPLWVVPAAPWSKGFEGSMRLLGEGAKPLTWPAELLASLNLQAVDGLVHPAEETGNNRDHPRHKQAFSSNEIHILDVLSNVSLHIDAIAARSGESASAVAAALLTLVLENVVVESPPGFFRRRDSRERVRFGGLSEGKAPDGKDTRGRGVAREGQDHQEISGGQLRGRRLQGSR